MQPNVIVPYDYSQPVVVNTFRPRTVDAPEPVETPESEAALQLFDDGLELFRVGDYRAALAQFDQALKQLPGDPVIHEVRALALFAIGEYTPAAAALNSLLATTPGMDWTTMSGLYGNVDDYTTQLRALEAHVKANPDDAAARFVLAYHYLVMGHNDSAERQLRAVVKVQPRDVVARKILESLAPSETEEADRPEPAADSDDAVSEEIDLVGAWRAKAGKTTVELRIDEDFGFVWSAKTEGEDPAEVSGEIDIDGDLLILDGGEQGAMAGDVIAEGPNRFRFSLTGTTTRDDNTLTFERTTE